MKRREVLTLLGGAAVWPLTARAQQPPMPVIGWLSSGSADGFANDVAAFRKGVNEAGFVEDRNVAIEFRWAEGQYDRLPALAADLVRRRVDVILASGGGLSVRAVRAASSSVPIVFTTGIDPVAGGLVESLNRPDGNVTGVTFLTNELVTKQLGLLHELLPAARGLAMLVNPDNPRAIDLAIEAGQAAASKLAVEVWTLPAGTDRQIDEAFASLDHRPADAMLIGSDPLFADRFDQIAALAALRKLPAIAGQREYVEAGGLMSYGASVAEAYRQAGLYVARVLRGEKPADLPVVQASKFELLINMKTAKALGLDVSNTLQILADEVIE